MKAKGAPECFKAEERLHLLQIVKQSLCVTAESPTDK